MLLFICCRIVDIPNTACTLAIPTAIFTDVDIRPNHDGPPTGPKLIKRPQVPMVPCTLKNNNRKNNPLRCFLDTYDTSIYYYQYFLTLMPILCAFIGTYSLQMRALCLRLRTPAQAAKREHNDEHWFPRLCPLEVSRIEVKIHLH